MLDGFLSFHFLYFSLLYVLHLLGVFACLVICIYKKILIFVYRIALFKSSSQINQNMHFAGYWIGGFGFGESTDERPALLSAVIVRSLNSKFGRLTFSLDYRCD